MGDSAGREVRDENARRAHTGEADEGELDWRAVVERWRAWGQRVALIKEWRNRRAEVI